MGRILLYAILTANAIISIMVPWIGVIAYYVVSVYNPAGIWYWVFEGVRYAVFTSVPVLVGFTRLLLAGRIGLDAMRSRQNLCLLIIVVSAVLSYVFSPFGHNTQGLGTFSSEYIVTSLCKILLFYIISIPLIDTKRRLHFLAGLMVFIAAYYTYWANERYLRLGLPEGRLAGPGADITLNAIYTDENCFAVVFVVGLPFLYYFAMYYRKWWLKIPLFLAIPFAWHAIFLTASRGALLGLGAVSLYIWFRSKHRFIIGAPLLLALVVAFVWQGGPMRERSANFVEDGEDTSTMGRINAWKAGFAMMAAHPITGVGIGNFMTAYPSFSDTYVRVAHNTIVQLGAETGILSALAYIFIFLDVYFQSRKLRKSQYRDLDPMMKAIHDATECSLYGFFVCSFFLNLASYELFYFLLLIRGVWHRLLENTSTGTSAEVVPQTLVA